MYLRWRVHRPPARCEAGALGDPLRQHHSPLCENKIGAYNASGAPVSGAVTTWRPILRTAIRALPAGESVTELSATDAWKGALPMIPD